MRRESKVEPSATPIIKGWEGDSKRHQGVAIVPWHLGSQEKTFKKVSVLSNIAEGSCSMNCPLTIGFCVVRSLATLAKPFQ